MTDRFGLLYDSRYDRELAARPAAVDFLEIIPDRFFALEDLGLVPDAPTSRSMSRTSTPCRGSRDTAGHCGQATTSP